MSAAEGFDLVAYLSEATDTSRPPTNHGVLEAAFAHARGTGHVVAFAGDYGWLCQTHDRADYPAFLARRASMILSPQGVDDLVGVTEIARRAGVQPDTVSKWRVRHGTFPAPCARLAVGDVWRWSEVRGWIDQHPRKPGRPKQDGNDAA